MTREKIELLQEELLGLQLAALLKVGTDVAAISPALLTAIPKVIAYADNMIQRYPE